MQLFNNEGSLNESISDKYEAGQELKGQEALALLAVMFSNTTHGNYEPEMMFNRLGTHFTVTIKKCD